ncbi:MAG: glycerophosphoryl diester phosphodiesterase membrane domain-containing protein [Sphingomicrobium sp.]
MAKLSISQAWDETRAILARDGKLIGAVALALFVLPGIILNLAMPAVRAGEVPQPGLWLIVVVLVLLVSLVGQLSVIRLAIGPHIMVREAIVHGARRLIPYLGAVVVWLAPIFIADSILYGFMKADPAHPSPAAALGVLVVSTAGLIIAVRLMLLAAVASAEDGNSFEILRRSWELTRGNWWRLFGFLVVFGVGALALLWAVQSVIGLVVRLALAGDLSPLSVGGLVVIIIGQLISGALSVILFVMLARLYTQRAGRAGAQASVPSSGI